MLVRKWRERNGRELSGLQPMHSCCINGNCFFWSDIWTIFQIIVLSFLACKNAKNNYREPKEQATCTKDKKWRIQYLCECNMRTICPYYIKKKEKQKKKDEEEEEVTCSAFSQRRVSLPRFFRQTVLSTVAPLLIRSRL